jgi:hypothetical protein
MPVPVFTVIFTADVWLKMISPVTESCEISVEVARARSGSPTRGSLLAGKRYGIHSSNGDCLGISPHGSRLMVPELPVFGLSVFLACAWVGWMEKRPTPKVNECNRLITTVVTSGSPSFVSQSGSPNKPLEIAAETGHNPEIWNCLMGYPCGVL